MKDELALLKQQISDLKEENLFLKSEVSYSKGKIEAYESFLRRQGFFKGGEE